MPHAMIIDRAVVQELVDEFVREYGDRADEQVIATTVAAAVDFVHALYLDSEPGALEALRIAVRHRIEAGLGGLGRRSPRLYGIRQRRRSGEDEDDAEELYDAV